MVVSLDDFVEQGRSIFNRLRENLEEVSLVVVVDQYLKFLDSLNIFLHLDASMFKTLLESLVVGVGDGQELDTSVSQGLDGRKDVISVKGNVLHTSTTVVIDVLLDLGFPLAIGRLVNRHLNNLVEICDDNRS